MDWKLRHKLFHTLFKDHDLGDDLSKETIVEEYEKEKIVQRATAYPVVQTKELYYPGKSYAIAVTFAKQLENNFGVDFYEALDDPDLLYGNDPYFVRYSDDKETYDKIIENFPWDAFEGECSENFKKTLYYFDFEFFLHEDSKQFLGGADGH